MPDVQVVCRTCSLERELPAGDPAALSAALADFFAAHAQCDTTIDLRGMPLPAPAAPHAEPARDRGVRGVAERRPRPPRPVHGLQVRLLGGYVVLRNGEPLPVPAGPGRQALAYVAVHHGRAPSVEVAAALWPRTGRVLGRSRLARAVAGLDGLLVPDGEDLVLPSGSASDVAVFLDEAQAALVAPRPAELARRAVERWTGELLPDDRDQEWTVAPRERVRLVGLQLLDLLASEAAGRGAVDEALGWHDRALAVDPADGDRYLAMARVLVAHGRTQQSREVVRRALAVLERSGRAPSAELLRLGRCDGA